MRRNRRKGRLASGGPSFCSVGRIVMASMDAPTGTSIEAHIDDAYLTLAPVLVCS